MNKTLYKVIFNKNAAKWWPWPNTPPAQANPRKTARPAPLCRRRCGFAPACHLVSRCCSPLGRRGLCPRRQPVAADKAAPANQQPTILQTANGLPQVNIQTPTSAGVSVNQYRQFDVDGKGVILNNSRSNTTHTGGWIQGNPWLPGGVAAGDCEPNQQQYRSWAAISKWPAGAPK